MKLDTIITIIKALWIAVGVISLLVSIIASAKGGKWKKIAQKLEPVAEQTRILMQYIKEAEQYTEYDGKEKFSQVLIKYALHCIETNQKFNEEQTTTAINALVDFTKQVNATETPILETE